jgi:putative membrane protein
MKSSWRQTAVNVVRGGLIGSVEVVPGVSGGTVALIVGIYERIILSAGHVVSGMRKALGDVPRGRGVRRAASEIRQADWAMLIPVAIGMLTALVLVARQVEGFIHEHPELARALFLGLVAAALVVPISMIGRAWRPAFVAIAIAAGVAAFVLTGLPPTQVTPTPPIIVASAAVAVSALVLPGLSGSFILLTFGLYEPALAAVNNRELDYLAWFVTGLAVGLAFFVKVLQWLLEHHRYATLAVLTGLMAGGMRALWPWQDDDRTLLGPGDNLGSAVGLFVLGSAVVLSVLLIGHVASAARTPRGTHARRPSP